MSKEVNTNNKEPIDSNKSTILPKVAQEKPVTTLTGYGSKLKVFMNSANGDLYEDDRGHVIKKVSKITTAKDNADSMHYYRYSIMEAVLLKQFKHTNIIQLVEISLSNQDIFLVMLDGNINLHQYINKTKFEERIKILPFVICQLVNVIKFLHNNGITYGDLKPSNLLIEDDGSIKLIDFGSIRNLRNRGEISLCGCTYIFAPLESFYDNYICVPSIDIWSLGVTIVQYITGRHMIIETEKKDVMKRLAANQLNNYSYPFMMGKEEVFKKIDPDIVAMLNRMLLFDKDKRITIDEIYNLPFIAKQNIEYEKIFDTKRNKIMYNQHVKSSYLYRISDIEMWYARPKLITWMFTICSDLDSLTSFCLSVRIFDNYLSYTSTAFRKNTVQLIAGCCIMLASFLVEEDYLTMTDLLKKFGGSIYSYEDIEDTTDDIMGTLDYQLYFPTFDWQILKTRGTVKYEIIKKICCDNDCLPFWNDVSGKSLIQLYDDEVLEDTTSKMNDVKVEKSDVVVV